ncbi:MAG: leucyl aminopeptidase family protein, partial [Gammaproteobacteria bacterium]
MNLSMSSLPLASQSAAAIVVAVYADGNLSPAATQMDKAMGGAISRLINQHKISLKPGQNTILLDSTGITADRLIVLCVGEAAPISEKEFEAAIKAAVKAAQPFGELALALRDVGVSGRDEAWRLKRMVVAAAAEAYRFNELKSNDQDLEPELNLVAMTDGSEQQEQAFQRGAAIAAGSHLARDLGNRPGNICTPSHLADQAQELAKAYPKLKVTVLEESDMRAHGMGSLLSVAKGSRQPPKLIVMEYKGGKAKAEPVALVGKGITFDSGGISIKPAAAMDE